MKDNTTSRRRGVRLAPGRQLQKDASRDDYVLVSPAGLAQLNKSAAAILSLCDGMHTREEIVGHILRSQDYSLAVDVREFLDAARRRGWIVEG